LFSCSLMLCLVSTSTLSTQKPKQKPTDWTDFFLYFCTPTMRDKFLCPNDYWADFFSGVPLCVLFLGRVRMLKMLPLFVFLFMILQWA